MKLTRSSMPRATLSRLRWRSSSVARAVAADDEDVERRFVVEAGRGAEEDVEALQGLHASDEEDACVRR